MERGRGREGTGPLARRQEAFTILGDEVDLNRDRALVERCQAGDPAPFGALYAQYNERLFRFCLRRLNDRHEAEDAAQEAFARAWKALPRLTGERHFYPWLTVIAGNICTDMLRRRARSTPTDDLELTAKQPVGIDGEDTSEDLVVAAVDGELVNRALGRLSERHRHVLAMREGSGWTYQQIADHEGVKVGTIETLLWRARQALKREFALLSESKEALAGFLIATGVLIRRTVHRAAHRASQRGASVSFQRSVGTDGGLRSALTGAAVAGAAVAAVFIAPHTLAGSSHAGSVGGANSVLADPPLTLGVPAATTPANATVPARSDTARRDTAQAALTNGSGGSGGPGDAAPTGVAGGGASAGSGGNGTAGSAIPGGPNGLTGATPPAGGVLKQAGQGLNGVTTSLGNTVTSVVVGLNNTVNGVTSGVGRAISGVTGPLSNATNNVTSGVSDTAGGVAGGVSTSVSGLLGGPGGGAGSTSGPTPSTTTTTTPTAPGVLGRVGNLLGGH